VRSIPGPIYETYERHIRARRRDRIKHFPGARYFTEYTVADGERWYVRKQWSNCKMAIAYDTAAYVKAFCEANNLTP
jgi:hypothetical protein